jgi:predicted amidophosphoribosyltransferase
VFGLTDNYLKTEGLELNFLTLYQYGLEEKLIRSLKQAECSRKNFDFVAQLMLQKMYAKKVSFKNVIWVTPASKHSQEIVKSINKITGLNKVVLVLREPSSRHRIAQKLKRKSERQVKTFDFLGKSVDNAKTYIFIDDVVATGSTAKAAWLALGKPAIFQIWSLAYRPKLDPVGIV